MKQSSARRSTSSQGAHFGARVVANSVINRRKRRFDLKSKGRHRACVTNDVEIRGSCRRLKSIGVREAVEVSEGGMGLSFLANGA